MEVFSHGPTRIMHRSWLLTPVVVLLLWSLGMTLPTSAQYFGRNKVQHDDFDFRSFQTEHFDIFYYPEFEQAARDAGRMAERWYRRHSRTFLRDFRERKPIIFYANDTDFQQTNIIRGNIGQGVGGVTESLKERVVMPMTGVYADTDHVLGHELVHSFQFDIALARADTGRFAMNQLRLWMIEGMAEYLTLGREHPHTAMWLRDATLRDDLPTISDLDTGRYFPYRFGQAYMAYIGGKYGDTAVTNLYKLAGRAGVEGAMAFTLGISSDSLSSEWIDAVKTGYEPLMEGRTHPDSAGTRILAGDMDSGDMNLSPAVSPDGRYVAYLSERDLFSIDLFVADAETGEVLHRLRSRQRDPHTDAIRFIDSAGSWSPDAERFAFVTFRGGRNQISIWEIGSDQVRQRISVDGVSAIRNPAWSPDGRRIAFAGMDGGLSNLYVMDIETREVRQLTNDRHADLQPTWSPDGTRLAFSTDRGPEGTDFDRLRFARQRIGLIDVETRETEVLRPFRRGTHHNPQFAPDGRSLYFISDHDGFKDIYRMDLDTEELFQVTEIKTGVSGITARSPAMSVAQQSGKMMFSTFFDTNYTVFSLTPEEAQGERMPERFAYSVSNRMLPGEARAGGAHEGLAGAAFEEEAAEPISDDALHTAIFGSPATEAGATASAGGTPTTPRSEHLVLADHVRNAPGAASEAGSADALSAPVGAAPPSDAEAPAHVARATHTDVAASAPGERAASPPSGISMAAQENFLPTLHQGGSGHNGSITGHTLRSVAADTTDQQDAETQERLRRRAGVLPGADDDERPRAGILPPFVSSGEGIVEDYLADADTGLPPDAGGESQRYRPRLTLDAVAPPSVGVQVGGPFGGGVAGGVGFFFSDMLGNHSLDLAVQANGSFRDIGGQATYRNLGSRVNYGATAGHIPFAFGQVFQGVDQTGQNLVVEERIQRIFIQQFSGLVSYPISQTRRWDFSAGVQRYAFEADVRRFFVQGPRAGQFEEERSSLRDPIYFFQSSLAYVGDTSFFGFTSPISGERFRIEASPRLGTRSFVSGVFDYRRYMFFNPLTVAFRGLHRGNYGLSLEESIDGTRIGQEFLGFAYNPGFLRGYSFTTFNFTEECQTEAGQDFDCVAPLQGTRMALGSVEARIPLLGVEDFGLLNFPFLPTELAFFADAGLAWDRGDNPLDLLRFNDDLTERGILSSVGASARVNLLGALVFELYYAYPFQRPQRGGHFGLVLTPGW